MRSPSRQPVTRPSAPRQTGPRQFAVIWQQRIVASLRRGIALIESPQLAPPRRLRKARQAAKVAAALLRLAPPGLKRKARGMDLALKGVRRMLSDSRDADARSEALARLVPLLSLPRRDIARLERALAPEGSTAATSRSSDLDEISRRFVVMAGQIEAWILPRGAGAAIAKAIGSDYRRLRHDMRRALADEDIETLHDLRKRVIRHRHQIALVAAVADTTARPRWLEQESRAKALGVALGYHRDDCLLDEALRSRQDPTLHNAAEAALAVLLVQQDKELGEARHLARVVTRKRRKRFQRAVGRVVSGRVPP